jgi:hypothetical protein
MRGADFANLLGHLMNRSERQDLAASGFQAVPIGQQIEVITAAAPLPDAASLLAFARGQGLDEATLQALFAEGEAAAQTTLTTPEAQVLAPELVLPAAVVALNTAASFHRASGETSSPASAPTQPLLALADTPQARLLWSLPVVETKSSEGLLNQASTLVSAQNQSQNQVENRAPGAAVVSAVLPTAPLALAPVLVPAEGPQAVGSLPQAAALASPAAGAMSSAASLAGSAAAVSGMTDLRWQAPVPAAAQTAALNPSDGISPDDAAPGQPLIDALRLRLAPQEAITRRLAAMAGTGLQSTWAAVAGQPAASTLLRLEVRDLGLPAPSAPGPAPLGMETPFMDAEPQTASGPVSLGPEAGRSSPSGASATSTPWVSTAAQRAEHYEQLAQRLGEALGQRLQSQLERGQWKMQMRLDPAHLGRIDLDLDMNSGALEAVFRSDNQLTRDLIAQGLPRLKESLSQSGTAVANVWVQGDSSRQSGGNPTPRRAPEPREQAAGHSQASQDLAVQAPGHRTRQGTSAWDVLA